MILKTEAKIDLPSSNVIQFVLADGTHITARPSGTEPKIKYYYSVKADTAAAVEKKLADTAAKFESAL